MIPNGRFIPDAENIRAEMAAGLPPLWQGTGGHSLLHIAATLGSGALVEEVLAYGVPLHLENSFGETAGELAEIWGYPEIAKKLAFTPEPLPFKTLSELRATQEQSGENIFYRAVRRGNFSDVLALAVADETGFLPQDLLTKGVDGDSALIKLCQKRQLSLLLDPRLWKKGEASFRAVWSKVPENIRREEEGGKTFNDFILSLRTASPRKRIIIKPGR